MQATLDAMAAEIRELRMQVIELSRAAHDGADDLAGAEAFIARAKLDQALHAYFDLAEAERGRVCPEHPNPACVIVSCLTCVRAARKRGGPPVATDPRFSSPA